MQEAQAHEWLCQKIIQESADAIMFSDRAGLIRLWNSGAEHMFGYSSAEVMGQSLDMIIPENLRGRHWEGYFLVMESGESHYSVDLLSAPALCKDGSRISTEFPMVLVKEEDGKVLGVAAVIRDVSARWQRDKELKERIMELESKQTA